MSTFPEISGNIDWRKSRLCDSGACVGVARQNEYLLISNTSDPGGPVSRFTRKEWVTFLAGAKLGDFDDLA